MNKYLVKIASISIEDANDLLMWRGRKPIPLMGEEEAKRINDAYPNSLPTSRLEELKSKKFGLIAGVAGAIAGGVGGVLLNRLASPPVNPYLAATVSGFMAGGLINDKVRSAYYSDKKKALDDARQGEFEKLVSHYEKDDESRSHANRYYLDLIKKYENERTIKTN